MSLSFEAKIKGAVLGAAIGDAMGHPTEFIPSFDAIYEKYGPKGVIGYELMWRTANYAYAPYTDDTQMAEIVLRTLVGARKEQLDLDATMTQMVSGFMEWSQRPQGGHRAPGQACLAGCRALKEGVPWAKAGGKNAGGCGSVMRAYPFGLVFHDDLQRAERWAALHSSPTHRDPIALAACAAMAVGTAHALTGTGVDDTLEQMITAAGRYSVKTSNMMHQAVDDARQGVEPRVTLNQLRGWAAHEAISAAVYIFARHHDDPRAAILEGANTPGDSDSIATLAGALVGARGGISSLPTEWIRDIERCKELLDLANTAYKTVQVP